MIPVDNSITTTSEDIMRWLFNRGIAIWCAKQNDISWDGERIVIPVYDKEGILLFNKYRRNPFHANGQGPKYSYDRGGKVSLYGIKNLDRSDTIIICEGELDALVLESRGFFAVTSTGGAVSFQKEWAALFEGKDTYVCFDNDKAGQEGILRVCSMIPRAKPIPLPKEVGEHGDITDYFSKLGKNTRDFVRLMEAAQPLPAQVLEPDSMKPAARKHAREEFDGNDLHRAKLVPMKNFLQFNHSWFAACPFHADKTPSLKLYKDNRWHCFGCGAGGDTVDFVMKIDGISFKEAIAKILGE